jgi:lactonase family protein with 7-bladed beta-propeller
MSMKMRALLMLIAAAATVSLSACGGGYTCNVTFGASTCNQSGSGIGTTGGSGGGGGGGGGGKATAYAFAVDQGGTLDGYTLSASAGTFAATSSYTAPAVPANDPGVGMVVAQGQFVYAIFELEDKILGWSLDSTTGSLTPLSGFPVSMTLNLPIVTYNQYNLATNPAGTLLFISDSGGNEVFVFQISSSGGLTAVTGSPFATPIEPGNLTTDGLGKYLYVGLDGSHTGALVVGYSIGSGGALTEIPGSPFTTPVWQLQGDASGNYLVGTSGNTLSLTGSDDNHLYVYSIVQTGSNAGAISAVTGSPFTTVYSPFTIAVQPASSGGEFVYSLSVNDDGTSYNPIEGYSLDTTSGALTAITGSPFSNLASGYWGQFDQSGAYLFAYSTGNSGSGTLTQIGALTVGSDGSLTQPISSLTLATPGYWVVTDP